MEIYSEIAPLKQHLSTIRRENKKIGFVPTMGALHEGHIRLVEESLTKTDYTVVSIFVNPTQFNNPEDLENYPRTLEEDLRKLREAGCHVVFIPEVNTMYSQRPVMSFGFGNLETTMEGKFRPGHFAGVGIVVGKLFNIVMPDCAFFGKKDFQQLAVIKCMVKDLNFGIEIIPVDTVREKDGLAMSSRNLRLTANERDIAPIIYRSLNAVKEQLKLGARITDAKAAGLEVLRTAPLIHTEYLEIVDQDRLEDIQTTPAKNWAVCFAGHLGKVRLIDNITSE